MTAERWHQITAIFHAALACDAAERDDFVASRCDRDESLRRAVQSMLTAHAAAGGFGETPDLLAALIAAGELPPPAMLAGSRLGRYEIGPLLGAGGMGAVYRATDTRLHRDVALKVLLPTVASDPERLARLGREAQVLASLNHPNIAQVHDLEEADGIRAVVMELIDGPTLAERIADGPVPIDEALAIARHIAGALDASHAQNIVHRDLKPANVKLRTDGAVKVLDFGLSKALDNGTEPAAPTSAAGPADATVTGVVLGTAAYMPPEQAKGMPVDRRADMWAFGCVLFELLSGRRAFAGESVSDVLANVVGGEPDSGALPPNTPPAVRTLIDRCLQKDLARRLDSASAACAVIDAARRRMARRQRLRQALPQVAAVAALSVLAAGAVFRSFDGEGPSVPRLQNARQLTFSLDVESYPAWSPDGTRLAYQASDVGWYYVGNHDIWVSGLGTGEPVNLTKGHPANDRMPSWSPDGRDIAFFSDRDGGWGVWVVPAAGGTPRRILDLPGMGNLSWSAPQWSSDGRRLLVSVRQGGDNAVMTLTLASLQTTRIVLPGHDGNVCFDLSVSPDGRRFAYVEGGSGETEVTRLWTIAADGSGLVPLTDGRTNVWSPTWSRDGRQLFYVSNRDGTMDMWQQAVASDGSPVGEPLRVTQGLGIRSAAFSADGSRVAYTRGGRISNVWRVPVLPDRPATWADAVQVTSERAFIEFVDVSPDGAQLALSSDRRGNQDLWLMSTSGGDMTAITADPTPDWAPRWSPSGSEIAFYSYRSGNRDVWVIPARGGPARQLTAHPSQDRNPRWSPDGSRILFHSSRPEGQGWWTVRAAGGDDRFLMTSGDSGDDGGDWSPDGRSLVLSKQARLYQVSVAGREPVTLPTIERPFSPRYSSDGQTVYYGVVTGPRTSHDLWRLSLADRSTRRLTQLENRRGRLGYIFSAGGGDLYFTWAEDDGDIWVMDTAAGGR